MLDKSIIRTMDMDLDYASTPVLAGAIAALIVFFLNSRRRRRTLDIPNDIGEYAIERLQSMNNGHPDADARRCIAFIPEIRAQALADEGFAHVEVLMCYGRWQMVIQALVDALDNPAADFKIPAERQAAARDLLARMQAA